MIKLNIYPSFHVLFIETYVQFWVDSSVSIKRVYGVPEFTVYPVPFVCGKGAIASGH